MGSPHSAESPAFHGVFESSRVFGQALAPEYELLLACAQPTFDDGTAKRVNQLLDSELDWQKLSELARNHGLAPIVYARLEPFRPRPLPEPLSRLKADAALLIQHALIHTGEMKRLIPYLEANGIETLVFKGPPLAYTLYGRIALRPFYDLDLLVQPRDVAAAWSLLAAEGYTLAYGLSSEQLPELIKAGNHLLLYRGHLCVELHWTFFPRTRATFFDTGGAWSRRVPLVVQETTVKTMAPRDLVHFLCLHGNKHAWCRLVWLADLAWFAFRYPEFDWAGLLDEARSAGTQRMVLVGLVLAHELFGSPLEAVTLDRIHKDIEVLAVAKWTWRRILRGSQDLPTGRELVELVMRTRERRIDRGRDLFHHVMALRPNNLQDAPRYARTPVAYSLHRLWYLVHKYGRIRS